MALVLLQQLKAHFLFTENNGNLEQIKQTYEALFEIYPNTVTISMLRFHRAHVYLTVVFLFTSMLADTLRSMDVSRSPDPLISYPRFPYHVPPAHVLVRFRSILRVSSYLYRCGLSTRLRLLVCLPFPLLCCRLVHLRFPLTFFSFCLVDLSMLTITAYAFPFVVRRLVSHLVISGL